MVKRHWCDECQGATGSGSPCAPDWPDEGDDQDQDDQDQCPPIRPDLTTPRGRWAHLWRCARVTANQARWREATHDEGEGGRWPVRPWGVADRLLIRRYLPDPLTLAWQARQYRCQGATIPPF